MQNKNIITLIVAIVFILGAGAIVYYGRPIMTLTEPSESQTTSPVTLQENAPTEISNEESEETEKVTAPTTPTTETTTQPAGTYTMAQVSSHATENDCWSSLNGNVYDLTSWVSRHPGGSKAIIGLCGTDATAKFEGKHGGSSAAQAALALLKIGTLAP